MTKQLEVQLFIAKQYPLYAVRLDKRNMEAAALACGGTLFSWKTNKYSGEPYIRLATRHGHIKVRSGMWLVEQNGKWASFTDHNFHRKYEMPDEKYIKVITVEEGGLPTELNYFDEAPPTNKTPSPYVREIKPVPTVQYQETVTPSDADQQEIEDQIARARAVMGALMVTLPAPTMDDLETMDLQDLVNPYDDSDAPADHRTHIVNPPANQHIWVPGMTAKEIVDIARANGWPVQTLCGYQFVPKRNPENYPACEPCMTIAGELMRGAGE